MNKVCIPGGVIYLRKINRLVAFVHRADRRAPRTGQGTDSLGWALLGNVHIGRALKDASDK